jgi:hypothetical protein
MSLYEITSEMMRLLAAFDEHGNESTEFDSAIKEHAAALAEAFDAKADGYGQVISEVERRGEARRAEADRLKRLAEADEVLSQRLRMMLLEAMRSTGRTKVETERYRISVRQNGGKIPVIVEDETAIPAEYRGMRMLTTVDKDSIREALEAGTAVAGARLGERGFRLDLK